MISEIRLRVEPRWRRDRGGLYRPIGETRSPSFSFLEEKKRKKNRQQHQQQQTNTFQFKMWLILPLTWFSVMFTSDAGGGRAGADVTGSFAYRWFSCPQRRQRRKEKKKERERDKTTTTTTKRNKRFILSAHVSHRHVAVIGCNCCWQLAWRWK